MQKLCFYISDQHWPARDHLRPGDTQADADGEPGQVGRLHQLGGGARQLGGEVRHHPRLRRHRGRGQDLRRGLRTPWRGPARP